MTVPQDEPAAPRRFYVVRTVTRHGRTGRVADGVQWWDGSVAVRWHGDPSGTEIFGSVEGFLQVHGHEGSTVAEWLD
jgi:hypothetical protein